MTATRPGEIRGVSPLVYVVKPQNCTRALAFIALGLGALHLGFQLCHYLVVEIPWLLRALFDLDEEESFGTWFSAGLLFLVAGVALLCGRRARSVGQPSIAWALLGAGFLILSIDEVVGLHETANTVTEFSWAIPGGMGGRLRRDPRSRCVPPMPTDIPE